MGAGTTISWCQHTFNPVWGCVKVDRGCAHCYAETRAKRWKFDVWGPRTGYREFGATHWAEPLAWNRDAAKTRTRPRVFPSMCDPFDLDWPKQLRARFWDLIRATPRLDWLLLTKRPENLRALLPADWAWGYSNVWLLASAHDQASLMKRTLELARIPALVRGMSLEPLVGDDVNLDFLNVLPSLDADPLLQWLIIGGESGGGAAPLPLSAATTVLNQALRLEIPVFFKQFGVVLAREYGWKNAKGEDPAEWPETYRVRQFPLEGVRRCDGCGCTDVHGCREGCFWVDDHLCSRCGGVA